MHYRSLKNLSDDIESWIPTLPKGLECIVGIPRSGMLVANILALKLNLPLTDVDGFLEGRVMGGGRRYEMSDREHFLGRMRRVMVVDDCVSSGRSLAEVRVRINSAELEHEVVYGCVYGIPHGPGDVLICREVPKPRKFEWNILSTKDIGDYCFDLDGVLCVDPPKGDNDDGERYINFIGTAKPLYLPHHPIGFIVTSRLERYRKQTEGWLQGHGIEFGRLLMLDLPTKAERIRRRAAAPFKAEAYKQTGATLFIESDYLQAGEIARLSNRYVYSVEHRLMISPEGLAGYVKREVPALKKKLRSKFRRIKARFT